MSFSPKVPFALSAYGLDSMSLFIEAYKTQTEWRKLQINKHEKIQEIRFCQEILKITLGD